ncbi:MAG: hypothetical protein KIT84_01335 [Labilithrix sp.]|nr:hypothetical protein [Labilithrix sp.]MCW5809629.1 hypothetical protein [Labilithrix sp.]
MDATALHLELRNALSIADELGRYEHAFGNQTLSAQLAATRTVLGELERDAGRTHAWKAPARPDVVERLERALGVLRDRSEEIPVTLRPRVVLLIDAVERIVFAEQRPTATLPAKPLFGALPLARVIPQDVHWIGDYLACGAYLTSAVLARTKRGRAMGLLLGLSAFGVSAITDYRLSLAKLISIELHELADHTSGAQAALAPVLLGYAKKDPIASAIQIACGLGTIALSLFTDYRAAKGITRARRSKGGPTPRRVRVRDAQRALEGLAGPSYFAPVTSRGRGLSAGR